ETGYWSWARNYGPDGGNWEGIGVFLKPGDDPPPPPAGQLVAHVDCGSSAGVPAGNWNLLEAQSTIEDLIDFNTGASTGISISNQYPADTPRAEAWNAKGWIPDEAGDDQCNDPQSGDAVRWTVLSNVPGPVTIEIVVGWPDGGVQGSYKVNDAFADRTFENAPLTDPGSSWNGRTNGRDGPDGAGSGDWMIWENVQPVDGEVKIPFKGRVQDLPASTPSE
ncbi:MAG: hypothetical protein GY720_02375, partial [bacterium]|nr:hypothetical protein [bacterium]